RHMLDLTNNLYWDQMTAAQRLASITRYGRGSFGGATANAALPSVLSFGSPEVRVLTPAAVAGAYGFGTANFGGAITSTGGSATVVAAVDAANIAGPSTTDGCTAFTNAADISGK